jgi:hypothetical protein
LKTSLIKHKTTPFYYKYIFLKKIKNKEVSELEFRKKWKPTSSPTSEFYEKLKQDNTLTSAPAIKSLPATVGSESAIKNASDFDHNPVFWVA